MNRREALKVGCAGCAALLPYISNANAFSYSTPQRFDRPDAASDEGGLWARMDREERSMRRSPLVVRDSNLHGYIQDIACRLGGAHCPDIRLYLVRTPLFNAAMAPNGMLQVWTGLLLRVENEAQLAAIIGHEIGHYLQRHAVDQLRSLKSKAAASQVLAAFGIIGVLGGLAVLSSTFSYGREHEIEADNIGAVLMNRAGYDSTEASRIWANLIAENSGSGDPSAQNTSLFATHPAHPERLANLERITATLKGGVSGRQEYGNQVIRFLDEWLDDEVKQGRYGESLVLIERHLRHGNQANLMQHYKGEVFRLRAGLGDIDAALISYQQATAAETPFPKAYRGIGYIYKQRGQSKEAILAFNKYIELAPNAPDVALIRNYVMELST